MTISEDVRDVAMKITDGLPPAFLFLLCLNLFINVVFVIGLLWFLHDLSIARIEAITKIFQACTTALVK